MLIGVHAGNGSEMNVRVDKAGDEVLTFAGDYGDAGRRFGRGIAPVDTQDAAVFEDDGAFGDVVEAFGRDDGDFGDPSLG